ncbi:MAG: glycosyltransferase [Actinomycetota bacterium]|nr:glycosyltransferase [Actinomycetota bacterium]
MSAGPESTTGMTLSAKPNMPATTPSVDVGLTAYRRATFIGEAIESVLGQTFDHWQLTICDNGVGGGEIERVVQAYLDDPRVSYRATGRELSLAENWTSALNQGNGRYAAVLNDDDRWHPGFLRARVEALEAHPECAFAFSSCVLIDEHGEEIVRWPLHRQEGVLERLEATRWLIRENPIVPPAIIVRRSACEAVGSFFDDTWQYCDWELWARMAARFPVYYLPRHDNDNRRHTAAYTFGEREPPDQLLDMFDHLEETFALEVEGFGLSRVERARIRSQILLRAASDVHIGVGWKGSGQTYRRALREYPPTLFGRTSLTMLARSLLGKRGSRLVSRLLRVVRPSSTRGPSA